MMSKLNIVLLSVLAAVGCSSPKAPAGCSCDCDEASVLKRYHGPTFEVASWRGEVSYHKIHDKFAGEVFEYVQKGCSFKDGVTVEVMSVAPLMYNNFPGSDHLSHRYDIVYGNVRGCFPKKVCKVTVDKDAKAGKVQFGPMTVRVVDRVLPPPAEWKYFLDLWQHPWAVSRYFEVEPFSDEHFEKMTPVYKTLAECGVKALTVTLLDYAWNHQCYDAYGTMIGRVKNDDGSWTFDYTIFDKYVEFGRKCGIGPDIACYTMCPWGYVVRWQDSKGNTKSATALPGSEIFNDYWGAFLVDFKKHLIEKGWFNDAYIAMDERAPKDVAIIAKFIQEKAPGMKIAMAGNRKPSDFNGIVIDNYSQYLSYITPEFLSEIPGRRKNGWKTTLYVCCGPERPNTFMSSADNEAFWLGVYPQLCGLDGFLRWAANSWPHDPYADASFGDWKAGDTYLVYPEGEYSSRLLSLRSGVVAAEKLRILKESGTGEKELKEFSANFHHSKAEQKDFDFKSCRSAIENFVNR